MTQPTGTIRPLNYPLNRSADIESITPNIPSITHETLDDWITTDSDEIVPVVLELSLNEYVALASAIDAGRDLAYGDNSIYLWWIWCRSIVGMDLCELIAECINTSSATQQAIYNLLTESTVTSLRDNAQSQGSNNMGEGNNPTCDLDVLFGGIQVLVDRAEQNNTDALEIFEIATNQAELIAEIFPNTAEDGTSLINAVLDWVQWMQDNIIENYAAQITTAYLDELKCDLFCLSKVSCVLTPSMITNYFYGRVSSALTFSSLFTETVGFLTTGVWSGTEIADVFFLSQFAIRAQVGGWLDFLGFTDIDKDMRIGMASPDSTWSIICTCDATYYLEADLTTGQHGWAIAQANRGVYSPGVGFIESDLGTSSATYIEYVITGLYNIQTLEMRYGYESSGNQGFKHVRLKDNGITEHETRIENDDNQPYPTLLAWNGNSSGIDLLDCRLNCSNGEGNFLIDRIRVKLVSATAPQEFYDDGWTNYVP